jgi:hypothetical protein
MYLTITILSSRYLVFLLILLAFSLSCNRKDVYSLFKGKKAVSLSISPMEKVVSSGLTVQYRAMANLEDGSTLDVTDDSSWTVSTLSGSGASSGTSPGSVIAGASTGTASVRASCWSLTSGDATLTVLSATSALFVSPLGSNSNTGTSDSPFLTVDHAIAVANPMAPIGIVIAEGDYSTTGLSLTVDGVSLYGGFDTNWSSDDFGASRARIIDNSVTGSGVKAAIECSAAITAATVIQGLEITATSLVSGAESAAISTAGSPTIQYCLITGGNGDVSSSGIYSTSTGPLTVKYCQISGGSGPGSSMGIYSFAGGNMTLDYCQINGGSGAANSYGFYWSSSAGTISISNTSILAGSSTASSYGFYSACTGSTVIGFSAIDGGSGSGNSYGIYQPSVNPTAAMVVYNSYIAGGGGSSQSVGVMLQNNNAPSPFFYNNIIASATVDLGSTTSICMLLGQSASPIIANNTFSTGYTTGTAKVISTAFGAQPYICNNIFMTPAGSLRYGIFEGYPVADPSAVMNNLFSTDVVNVFHDDDTSSDWDVAAMFTAYGASGTGNIQGDPGFVSADDLHPASGSPVIGSGLNGMDEGWSSFPLDDTSTFPIDLDGDARPGASLGAWDIGAYQH